MIIGGAYQGKLNYVMNNYGILPNDIFDGEEADINDISNFKCIINYHFLIKRLTQNNKDPVDFTLQIIGKNPNVIIIMNEIGNGIIPLEKNERLWREQVGRVGCILAEKAETVERVVCGISLKIKD